MEAKGLHSYLFPYEHEVKSLDDLVLPYPVFAFIWDDDKYSDQVYFGYGDYLFDIDTAKIRFYATKGTVLQVWISESNVEKYYTLKNQGLIREPR